MSTPASRDQTSRSYPVKTTLSHVFDSDIDDLEGRYAQTEPTSDVARPSNW